MDPGPRKSETLWSLVLQRFVYRHSCARSSFNSPRAPSTACACAGTSSNTQANSIQPRYPPGSDELWIQLGTGRYSRLPVVVRTRLVIDRSSRGRAQRQWVMRWWSGRPRWWEGTTPRWWRDPVLAWSGCRASMAAVDAAAPRASAPKPALTGHTNTDLAIALGDINTRAPGMNDVHDFAPFTEKHLTRCASREGQGRSEA